MDLVKALVQIGRSRTLADSSLGRQARQLPLDRALCKLVRLAAPWKSDGAASCSVDPGELGLVKEPRIHTYLLPAGPRVRKSIKLSLLRLIVRVASSSPHFPRSTIAVVSNVCTTYPWVQSPLCLRRQRSSHLDSRFASVSSPWTRFPTPNPSTTDTFGQSDNIELGRSATLPLPKQHNLRLSVSCTLLPSSHHHASTASEIPI